MAKVGMLYKFFIKTKDGRGLYKADPFANYAEQRPGTASRITDITKLRWSDAAWMEARKQRDNDSLPVSIYEVHPGSWKKHPHGEDEVCKITCRICEGNGLYACRADGDCGASV